jgi:hypothetical protein
MSPQIKYLFFIEFKLQRFKNVFLCINQNSIRVELKNSEIINQQSKLAIFLLLSPVDMI